MYEDRDSSSRNSWPSAEEFLRPCLGSSLLRDKFKKLRGARIKRRWTKATARRYGLAA